jgi:ligand-binding sensor domain-containing protein/signal transduction histidine kinase
MWEPSARVQGRLWEGAYFTLHCRRAHRRLSASRRFCIVFWVPFLLQFAPPASSQTPPEALHKGVDKRHLTAIAGLAPQAKLDPHPISLPLVEGTEIRFRRLSTFEGLLQTKVAQIVQDDEGFMWFGTQHGLIRYDGYNLRRFVNDPKDPNSLSGVPVGALFKDRDGALWVGCDQFLNRFDRLTEKFTRLPVALVKHISQDTAGVLWLATPTGLYRLNPATARLRRYSHHPDEPLSLSSNNIESSGEDKNGRFWVASTHGLEEFDRTTGKVMLQIPLPEPSPQVCFYQDRTGVFWIYHVTGTNVLATFDQKSSKLRYYSFHGPARTSTTLTGITAMLEDRNGNLWLSTHGAGLVRFDRDHRTFIRYRNSSTDPDSLPQNNVESLFADREGNMWAGLGRMGIAHFGTKPLPFRSFHHLDSASSTVQPFVGAIYEDSQRILWIGTPAALNRIDPGGHYTYYRSTVGPTAGTDVISIREDRSGNLWVGTYGHGLLRFDRRTGQFKEYQHNQADPYSISSDVVFRLLIDHKGTFWVATSGGLNRFDAATGRFTAYKPAAQGEPFYLELVEDRDGTLWLGTQFTGLHHLDPSTGKFTIYQHDMNRPGSLSDNRVNSVYFDRSGAMWVGTQNGLNKFDQTTGRFTVYTRRDGLPGNAVGCVLEDNSGDLWMSTDNGVERFNRQRKTFTNYLTEDGLPGPDLTGWGACFKSQSGEMFFGGFSGATAFLPEKVTGTSLTPPTVLTDFRLFGNSIEIGRRSPLQQSISFTKDLILSHDQNIFSLSFAALSFTNPATNRYRYMLEGLEHDWNEAGSDRRQATYTTLPSGTYTFRVQGAASGGPWSEPGVALRIKILPPWWGTLWFQLTFGLLTLLTLWFASRLQVQKIARQFNIRTEERVNERTRIARDLHDTLLQGFQGVLLKFDTVTYLIRDRPAEAEKALGNAIEQARAAITEGRDAVQGLRASTVVANDLARAITTLCGGLASAETDENCPAFRVRLKGKSKDLSPLVRDEVYQIAGEALRNAFWHAQARTIEVEIRYDHRQFRLEVADNGKGIDPAILSAGRRAGHYGLPGMNERAELAGGKLSVWSRLDSGTQIELTIPASIAYAKSTLGRRSMSSGKETG